MTYRELKVRLLQEFDNIDHSTMDNEIPEEDIQFMIDIINGEN